MLPTHDAAWWAKRASSFDFSLEDRLDADAYNRLLWRGLLGNRPYPVRRSGKDLRDRREAQRSTAQ
jgi:hypothetical protein